MSQILVECVPNFSEGRDNAILEKITCEIVQTEGAVLLDVDPGPDTNRTVVTFVGNPEAVVEAAFKAIKKASEVIDMRCHKGAHPRFGACDVCPFVPISGITMEECAELARILGKRVGEELSLPVYLYEHAASCEKRRNLAVVREGEYEALSSRIITDEWKPDFGPAKFIPTFGTVAIGAREFLIAYNINLNTSDEAHAKWIASRIREKGYFAKNEDGKFQKDENGNKILIPGLFSNCKAGGWYLSSNDMAQVTMNLTNYKITPVHIVFDKVSELAIERGVRVTGSEIVGLIPRKAMIDAGKYFLRKQGQSEGVPESKIIETAIRSLGLRDIASFVPKEKIIEYSITCDKGKLTSLNVSKFADEVSIDTPAPGGGSVAALCGALSSALSSMVANLTFSKKRFKSVKKEMGEIAPVTQELKDFFLSKVDEDTASFNKLFSCFSLPENNDEERCFKADAIEKATREATLIPFSVLEKTLEILKLVEILIKKGNPNQLSDSGVAGLTAYASARGAYYNVLINIPGITDEKFKNDIISRSEQIFSEIECKCRSIDTYVIEELKKGFTK